MRAVIVAAITLAGASGLARGGGLEAQEARPTTLVVTIVIDQLRADLIERYDSVFTGGFRRFLDEGFRFTQASHAHARTSTAPAGLSRC